MSGDSIAVAIPLFELLQLNLVRRRLRSIAVEGRLTEPIELAILASIMDDVLPTDASISELVREHIGALEAENGTP